MGSGGLELRARRSSGSGQEPSGSRKKVMGLLGSFLILSPCFGDTDSCLKYMDSYFGESNSCFLHLDSWFLHQDSCFFTTERDPPIIKHTNIAYRHHHMQAR